MLSTVNTVSAANSSVIYVNDLAGNDIWDGESAQWISGLIGPKKSIKNATGTVDEGGTVIIAKGNYGGANNTDISINKTMTIIGQSREGTILNGDNKARIFNIQYGKNLTIQNLTFINGYSNGSVYSNLGGAIFSGDNLNVNKCTFIGNKANNDGGAIYITGNLNVTDSTFISNSAITDSGGAIFAHAGTLTVSGSTFTGNSAHSYGGAIYSESTLNVNTNTFTSNIASTGGAICNNAYGTANVNNSIFKGNNAIMGGAICNYIHSILNVTGSIFTDNSADKGGAISNDYANLTVIGSTFTGNRANYGAIYNEASTLTVNFCKIIGNTPLDIYRYDGSVNAEYNWWGSNASPSGRVYGVTIYKWLVLTVAASPTSIGNYKTSTITADLRHDNTGALHTEGYVPNGMPVIFKTTLGTITSQSSTVNGIAKSTLKSGSTAGTATISAKIDSQTATKSVKIVDTIAPKVTSTTPKNKATGISRSSTIAIKFSENIKASTYWSKIYIKDKYGKKVSISKWIKGNTLYIKTTRKRLSYSYYTVYIPAYAVKDYTGNKLATRYTFKFKTGKY